MERRPYYEQIDIENTMRLRELISTLPPFVTTFFRGIEQTTASRTRIAYAYDLRIFFHFLQETNPYFKNKELKDISIDDLDKLKVFDIEEYMEYLKYYSNDEHDTYGKVNKERGISRKISSLKAFYNYFYKSEMIKTNPAALVTLPKKHEKEIIRLDADEVALLLDFVENGDGLTEKQLAYHKKNKIRDLAIMTLMLGTGIRVSECVGIDIKDVDLKNDGVKVHRKGGKEVIVYFGDEVRAVLLDYMEERKRIIPEKGHENALFLSMQNKRISVRSIENMVKKYSALVTNIKHITPHKLRSTYGTNLYKETGDIYLVADVLGHSDVNTTRKHYAAIQEDRRRSAKNAVKLREP